MKNLSLVFLLCCGHAFATVPVSDCATLLEAIGNPRQIGEAVQYFQSLGLNSLLAELSAGQVEVRGRRKWTPWQADVSARINLLGKKILVIRKVDVSTPKKLQEFRWEIAMALFELQMRPALWSRQALLPTGTEFPDSLQDLKDLRYKVPSEWRDQQLARTKPLLRELYTLFQVLTDLEAKDLMPAKDPGLHWVAKDVFFMDASQSIAPNLADFELWKNSEPLDSGVFDARHGRSVIFNYYMNHVKRMLMMGSVVSTLFLAPHLLEIPSFIESHQSWVQWKSYLGAAPARTEEVEQATRDYQIKKEIRRVNADIAKQEAMPVRDEARIFNLKTELQNMVERTPGEILSAKISD